MNVRNEERWKLYESGLTDTEIGAIQMVDRTAIAHWRRQNSLDSNASKARPRTQLGPMRHLLSELGWGVKSIAKFQGVSDKVIKEWRQRHGVPARVADRPRKARERRQQIEDLQRRVVRAVGHRLPYDIAADAAAELMLAVIEGSVPIDAIEQKARQFGNQALQKYANAFTTKSLDDEIPGYEGITLQDTLVDPSSSIWLERMGATVH